MKFLSCPIGNTTITFLSNQNVDNFLASTQKIPEDWLLRKCPVGLSVND